MANIVVVDDEKIIRILLKEILQKQGHSVEVTQNGNEAIELINEKVPDLVITDIFMPEKSGLEIIMELAKEHPNIKTIAISGDSISRKGGHLDCLSVAKDLGSIVILEKPFTLAQVLDAVDKALNQ